MKKVTIYVSAVLLSMVILSGCSFLENLLSVLPAIAFVDPSDADLSFDEGKSSREVALNANFEWTASSGAEWCAVNPSSGNGNGVVVISVSANDTGNERETDVVIGNETVSIMVKVFQEADDQLIVEGDSHVVSSEGGRVSFKVVSNVDYVIDVPELDWLEEVSSESSGNSHLFAVAPNAEYEGRTAVIKVRAGKVERKVEIMQLQKNAIVVSGNVMEISHEAGTFSLTVGSNVSYTVRTSADWLSLVRTRTFEESQLEFEYTANPAPYERTATITLTDGNITQFVDVVQGYETVVYKLSFLHDNSFMTIPSVSGENLTGTIFWGDGQEETFNSGSTHQYDGSSDTWSVDVEFIGSSNGVEIEFRNLEGIQEIDLSGM